MFNETLAEIYDKKYKRPVSVRDNTGMFMGVITSIVLFILLIKLVRKLWLKYQSTKDRSYNVFDKADLNSEERVNLRRWKFTIPETMAINVN